MFSTHHTLHTPTINSNDKLSNLTIHLVILCRFYFKEEIIKMRKHHDQGAIISTYLGRHILQRQIFSQDTLCYKLNILLFGIRDNSKPFKAVINSEIRKSFLWNWILCLHWHRIPQLIDIWMKNTSKFRSTKCILIFDFIVKYCLLKLKLLVGILKKNTNLSFKNYCKK